MVLKPCQNKKDRKLEPAASKMMSFSQLPAAKYISFLVGIPNKYSVLLISLGL